MKPIKILALLTAVTVMLTACNAVPAAQNKEEPTQETASVQPQVEAEKYDGVEIRLSDDGITLDGEAAGTDPAAAVYTANDIVYYETGKDFTYGEGSQKDAHTPEEAAAHTVVHIAKPGTYILSGNLSKGQIAVDLGDDAKKDPDAVVTLVLNGVDITCDVAPAVIFYNVYECGNDDAETATRDVDTSAAGANVIIADGTVNNVKGAYVARIYKPDTVVLNEDGTEVEDAKKLHKYDAAFYSKRTMNIFGGRENTGKLYIQAANEGLDSELHLTINGGNIYIESGNDGINTNEDGVSVTTINGGSLTIRVTGETGEGDGIDSNGWLVINGGTVISAACSTSADGGIDSDMGIHINGGTVIASGSMLDQIEAGGQNYAVFNFGQRQSGSETVTLKDAAGKIVAEMCPGNAYSILIYSSPELKAGSYTLWSDETQLAGQAGGGFGGGMFGGFGMGPGGMTPPEGGFKPGEDFAPPEGFDPGDFERPSERPEGGRPGMFGGGNQGFGEKSTEFVIQDGGNTFSISVYEG